MGYEQDVGRVISLDGTALTCGGIVEVVGIPVYVSDVGEYADWGIEDTGWYVFTRVLARETASNMKSFTRIGHGMGAGLASGQPQVTVEGAAAYLVGNGYVDIAVRFEVAAQSVPVTIHWGATTETIIFRASDLAVRNLDYRTTFYIYDLEPYCTWEYAVTTDERFSDAKTYYTLEGGEYVPVELGDELLVGDPIPSATTHYTHTKLTIAGMVKNVTYKLDTLVDCPIEVVLPDVPDDGYGAWYEIQMRYGSTYSMTLTPPTGVKIATDATPAQSAGVNIVDLHYASVGGLKTWRLVNTHSTITPVGNVSLEWATPPDKVAYASGEALDLAGARVVVTRADGSRRNVTANCTYSPASGAALTTADTQVTASYAFASGSLTASTPITVTEG